MARRAVEALAEVAEQPAASSEELLASLVSAGRELAESRPGVGAVAGAVGRVLAAANAHLQLEVDQLQQLVREEAAALVDSRNRAAASIAIQLRERLEEAVVLTHSASGTVREALLLTPPERVICTVSSPQDEGRQFSEELRGAGLEVELVEDDRAPAQLSGPRSCSSAPDTVFRFAGQSRTRRARGELARGGRRRGDRSHRRRVRVIKLAPMDRSGRKPRGRDVRPHAARS